MLDSISGVALGIFLLSVAVKGNTTDLINLAKRDKAFLQWAVAVGILLYLHGIPELRGAVSWLIAMAFIGLLLNTQGKLKDNVSVFWKSLGA